jgi:PTS system beta-glucosides-specific IIC component
VSGSINGVEGLSIFGIPLPTSTYASSFIPIILAVWFMGKVTMFLQKRIPQFMQYFLNPVLILVICVPVTLLFFGPIGIWIGDGIGWFFGALNDTIGSWIVVMLYAGLQPFIIMFGAGNFMMPLSLNFLNTLGYDPIFLGAATISDIAVSGAMLGYFLRARAAKQKQLFATVSFSAIMGVTEPAIYGAFVKFRRPFFAVMIGGGIGGLFAGLMQVKTYSMVWGLMGLPSYAQGEDFSNFGFMVASVVIGFVAAAIAAYILGIPAEKTKEATPVADDNNGKAVFSSVAEGELIPLASVKDPAFSTGTLGEGVGVIPSTDAVYAPFAGEVAVVFPTKHAFAIKADNGAEILIHIGIDTVNLNGQHFDTIVKQGDRVTQGQLLAKVDFAAVKAAGYDTTIIVIVSNTADYKAIEPAQAGTVTKDSEIFTVVK